MLRKSLWLLEMVSMFIHFASSLNLKPQLLHRWLWQDMSIDCLCREPIPRGTVRHSCSTLGPS